MPRLVENGSHFDDKIAIIDYTKDQISRPVNTSCNHQSFYSRHKEKHFLTYQSVNTPYGLITCPYGSFWRRCYDLMLFRQSWSEYILSEVCNQYERQSFPMKAASTSSPFHYTSLHKCFCEHLGNGIQFANAFFEGVGRAWQPGA